MCRCCFMFFKTLFFFARSFLVLVAPQAGTPTSGLSDLIIVRKIFQSRRLETKLFFIERERTGVEWRLDSCSLMASALSLGWREQLTIVYCFSGERD